MSPEEFAKLQAELLNEKKSDEKKMSAYEEFIEVFTGQVCSAQEFVRALNGGERSVVSLRDVARCIKVYHWFGQHFAAQNLYPWVLSEFFNVQPPAHFHIRQAVVMSLAYCYHARLPRDQRALFRKGLEDAYLEMQKPLPPPAQPKPQERDHNRYGGGFRGFGRGAQDVRRAVQAQIGAQQAAMGPRYGARCIWLDMTAKFF